MAQFQFKCPATETLQGTAFFAVEAESEDAARALLAEDASEYFVDFSETDGSTEWTASASKDWKIN